MHLSSPSTKELHGSSFWTKQEKGRKRERGKNKVNKPSPYCGAKIG